MDLSSIQYPHFVTWRVDISGETSAFDIFGKETARRIKKSIKLLEQTPYRFAHEKVTDAYFDKFIPLYESYIGAKKNALVFDVRKNILERMVAGRAYGAISLYRNDEFLGGLIYGVRDTMLSIAYRVFPKSIDLKLPISIGFVGEYYFYQEGITQKKECLSHGIDRNVYGKHASIGLPLFKLQAHAFPIVSTNENNSIHTGITHNPKEGDYLIFLGTEKGSAVRECLLISADSTVEQLQKKYPKLFSIPEQLIVHIVSEKK